MRRIILIIILMTIFISLVFVKVSYMAEINNGQELYKKGINYLDNYQSPFALDCFYKIIKEYPYSKYTPKSIRNIMQTYYFFQEYNKVISLYQKYEKLIKEHMEKDVLSVGEIYSLILASYYDLGKYDKVLFFSEYNGLFDDKTNEEILMHLAAASLRLNKYTLFEKYDKKITNYFSKGGLGFILFENGRIEQSFKYFTYFFNNVTEKDLLSDNGVKIVFSLGYAYLKADKGLEFHNYLNPILEKFSYEEENLDKILFILGKVQMESNLYNEAMQSFEKIKRYYTNSNLIEDCNNYIKELNKKLGS